MKNSDQTSLFPLYLVNFLGVLGFSMVIPFLYILITRLGGNPILYGFIGATYPAFQFIGAPLLGQWSDISGRKRILFISQAGTLISWLILLAALFVPNTFQFEFMIFGVEIPLNLPLFLLFFSRAFDGLTGGNISIVNAMVADVSITENRSRNFGRLSVSNNLGFVAGPALAGILGSTQLEEVLPVIFAAAISALALVMLWVYLPDDKDLMIKKPKYSTPLKKKTFLYYQKGLGVLFAIYFIIFFGFNIFYTAFPVHAVQALSWGLGEIGIFFSLLSLMMVLVQGPLLSRLVLRFKEQQLIIAGCGLLTLNFFLLQFTLVPEVYLAALFFALGNGIMWPTFLTILASQGTPENQGAIQGTASAYGSIASIFGLIAGGFFYQIMGASAFAVAAGSMLVVMLYFILRSKKK